MTATLSPVVRPGRERGASMPDSNPPLGASAGVRDDTTATDRINDPTVSEAKPLPRQALSSPASADGSGKGSGRRQAGAVSSGASGDTTRPASQGRALNEPEPLSALVGLLDWASGDDGRELTREARCVCGAAFVQRQLSPRYLGLRKPGEREALARECPGFWVPLGCGRCEHVQLGADARRDEAFARLEAESWQRRGARSGEDGRYEREERAGMSTC